ncbi:MULTISPECIES: hypothetical protein [unclassified Alteromonas]|uniref:hypothetical protein n=1 Tax=unclassified Alteromonas TaxID=2614992 RepID=UPI0005094901|nr:MULTISPECIES: hypothetical protein [unclassified Alteromonas]
MSIFETLLTGISTSLVATFIFILLSWYTKNIVLPWYSDKVYRGVRVDGKWVLTSIGGNEFPDTINANLELNQKGDLVKGLFSHHMKGKDEITSYTIKGEIRNSTINITAWPISKYQLDSASFLMKIYSDQGLRLTGTLSYVSSTDNLVKAEKVEAKMVRS